MLGNVNWCCISTTKEFITASAVYYREQRFAAENAVVVVVGKVFRNLVQCLTSTSLEQYLISGTLEQQWLNFGHKSVTVSDFRNSTILKHYQQ